MYQNDLILNEVRRFALLLARLMGLKTESLEEYKQQFDKALQNEYDMELEQLLALTEEEFTEVMRSSNYGSDKLNALSQLLYMFAQPFKTDEETRLLLKKVLIIFDLLEQKYHSQTFENIDKRNTIYRYLNTYDRSHLENPLI